MQVKEQKMDIEKIRQKIANFDLNAAVASVVSTVGSMGTDGLVTIGYFVIAFVTAGFTLKQSNVKAKRDDEMRQQEIELKRTEVRAKQLENELKEKQLDNGDTK